MADKKAKSPRARREAVFAEMKVLGRLIDRLLVRARTHAGPDTVVGKRLEEVVLVNHNLGTLLGQLEAIEADEAKRAPKGRK